VSLRAQVLSHLDNQLGNSQLPIQTWHWLRKLRLTGLREWQPA